MQALHSRCTVIDFAIKNGQKVKTAQALLKRLGKILEEEKIKYDNKVLGELIRNIIQTLDVLSMNFKDTTDGKIDSGILFSLSGQHKRVD